MDQATFWRKLFDFHFNQFITKDVLGIVYALGLVVIAISYLGAVVHAFGAGSTCFTSATGGQVCSGGNPAGGVIVLIFGFIVALLVAIYLRIILEVVAVLFAIHYDIKALSVRSGQLMPPP